MTIFLFDNTFSGLLTAVFEAYAQRVYPDVLQPEGKVLPLFCDLTIHITTDEDKVRQVWRGLQKKLSASALKMVTECWLAEESTTASLLFQYMRQVFDTPVSIETNFADPVVLDVMHMWKRVDKERVRLMQFVRFQKTADGIYFAAVAPQKNALPLVVNHFFNRFLDQPWIIYDVGRSYGFYYDLEEIREVTLMSEEGGTSPLSDGQLPQSKLADDEKLFQDLWRTYFKSVCIKERINPRKQRQDMPVRYWKYLTEKHPDYK